MTKVSPSQPRKLPGKNPLSSLSRCANVAPCPTPLSISSVSSFVTSLSPFPRVGMFFIKAPTLNTSRLDMGITAGFSAGTLVFVFTDVVGVGVLTDCVGVCVGMALVVAGVIIPVVNDCVAPQLDPF